jgi:hypothetical protein
LETQSKPTSTTKLDKLFNAWDAYCVTFDVARRPGGKFWTEADRVMRNKARSELDRLNVQWGCKPNGKSYGVCGCIILVRPEDD